MAGRGRLEAKVALVTGAAQGIGEAIARRLADEGAAVVVADIQVERGQSVARELGEHAAFLRLDVREPGDWDAALAATAERWGGLDVLVNNAGGGSGGAIDTETPEQHREVVELNLTGVWTGIKAAVPVLASRGGGSIVNISSIDGLAGVAGLSTYVATKFAVTGMTRSLALELGGRGIRVNSVHPGITETPLVQSIPPQIMQRLTRAVERQPIARMGRPEEVANAVLFFASDESSYCTGASLVVDGGHLAGPYRDPV